MARAEASTNNTLDRSTLTVTPPQSASLDRRIYPAPSGCWIWLGKPHDGYGRLVADGREQRAHRWVYEQMVGPIPRGLQLDHLCRVRRCVNPLHLDPVDARTNLMRGLTHAAANIAKTHCPYGHPYDEANTFRKRNGRSRGCRECNRLYLQRRRAAA